MLNRFRTYTLSVTFYRSLQAGNLPCHLRDQLKRASSSVCLNLAEGYGRMSSGDICRFYKMAFGSLREVQAIFDLGNFSNAQAEQLDHLAASLYQLIRKTK